VYATMSIPNFTFQLDEFLFTFRTKVKLMNKNKIYIEYDIEVNDIYCVTTCAKEFLSCDKEHNFRLKAAAKLIKTIKTVGTKKKVIFNKTKQIHEYDPLKQYEQSFLNSYNTAMNNKIY
jgi:hypothetical protein